MVVGDIKAINHSMDWYAKVTNFITCPGSARALLLVTEDRNHKDMLKKILHEVLPNATDYQSNVMWVGADNEKINTDQIRGIYGFLSKTSYNKFSRIIIIENVDELNLHSGNALLKILEDCAVDAFFILLCANVNLVIPTIRSRCIRMTLPRGGAISVEPDFKNDFTEVMADSHGDIRILYEFIDRYFSKDTSGSKWSEFKVCVYGVIEDIIKDRGGTLDEKIIADFEGIYRLLDNASKCSLSLYNAALLILQKLKGRNDR